MSGTLTVPLRSRRRSRAQAIQKFQHAAPAAVLVFTGIQGLVEGASGAGLALALVEVLTGALLLVTLLRNLRRSLGGRHASHSGPVDWAEILAAAVLFVEAWEHYLGTHHVRRPVVLMAVLTLFAGLFHRRIARATRNRRSLIVSGEQLSVGGPFWRSFRAPLAQVAEITVTATRARFRSKKGLVRSLDLADLENAEEVRAALEVARRRLAGAAAAPVLSAGVEEP